MDDSQTTKSSNKSPPKIKSISDKKLINLNYAQYFLLYNFKSYV